MWAQVLRVSLLTLKNLLANPELDVGPDAVEAGLPKVVAQRLLQVPPVPPLPRPSPALPNSDVAMQPQAVPPVSPLGQAA